MGQRGFPCFIGAGGAFFIEIESKTGDGHTSGKAVDVLCAGKFYTVLRCMLKEEVADVLAALQAIHVAIGLGKGLGMSDVHAQDVSRATEALVIGRKSRQDYNSNESCEYEN